MTRKWNHKHVKQDNETIKETFIFINLQPSNTSCCSATQLGSFGNTFAIQLSDSNSLGRFEAFIMNKKELGMFCRCTAALSISPISAFWACYILEHLYSANGHTTNEWPTLEVKRPNVETNLASLLQLQNNFQKNYNAAAERFYYVHDWIVVHWTVLFQCFRSELYQL